MKAVRTLLAVCVLASMGAFVGSKTHAATHKSDQAVIARTAESGWQQPPDKLVYADFETVSNDRPVSSRGGYVQLQAYSERPTLASHFKGKESTDAPELVRLSQDSPNRAITFEFELQGMNQYAGVSVVVHGRPDQDGKSVADDVSGFKFLSFQLYVTGVTSMSAEFLSNGQGIDANGYPQMSFKVNNKGFNTYLIPLNSLNQQSWAQPRLSTKDVLKKLTAVKISVSCNTCQMTKGTIVLDNLVFQN